MPEVPTPEPVADAPAPPEAAAPEFNVSLVPEVKATGVDLEGEEYEYVVSEFEAPVTVTVGALSNGDQTIELTETPVKVSAAVAEHLRALPYAKVEAID